MQDDVECSLGMIHARSCLCNCSLFPSQDYVPAEHAVPLTDKEKLLAMCKQSDVISLTDFFSEV